MIWPRRPTAFVHHCVADDCSKPADPEDGPFCKDHNWHDVKIPQEAVTRTFSWENLGFDEGGLPVHFPISQTETGQGPTEPEPAHHYTCWCGDPECPLSLALQHSWMAGRRKGHVDAIETLRIMDNAPDWEGQGPSMGFQATLDQELTERPGYLRRHPDHA